MLAIVRDNDPWALPLLELVKSIPKIGEAPKPSRLVDYAWTKDTHEAVTPATKAVR